ncbi:MAG: S41 family peptidase, partial [Pseudomonadota bacterium]
LSTWESRALNPKRWWFNRIDDNDYRLRGWLLGVGGKIRRARHAFAGDVTVLSSAGNSSGSTMLIGALQAERRVRIVGERTGGNPAGPTAGVLFFLKLPASGLTLRLPAQRIVSNHAGEDTGMGVIPDVEVVPTVDDLRAGRDAALSSALTKAGAR